MPAAIIFGGVNGAGKTTFARHYLELRPDVPTFLNADELKRDLPPGSSDIDAGRALLKRLTECVAKGESFALETTLSSSRYARHIPTWRSKGYHVTLHYLQVESVDLAIARVKHRTGCGGHMISERDIRRRYTRSAAMFERDYKLVVDAWYHYHSDHGAYRLIDQGGRDG